MEDDVLVIGRANEVAWFLTTNGQPLTDLSGVIKALLVVDDLTIDSTGNGLGFLTLNQTAEWRAGVTRPVVTFALKNSGLLAAGDYHGVQLITVDADHPLGVVWKNDIRLRVVPA